LGVFVALAAGDFCMDLERLRSERSRLLADLAKLDQRVHEMQLSAAV
jgi:hypothetical protein